MRVLHIWHMIYRLYQNDIWVISDMGHIIWRVYIEPFLNIAFCIVLVWTIPTVSEVSGENIQYLAFQNGSIKHFTRKDFSFKIFFILRCSKSGSRFSINPHFYSVDQIVFFKSYLPWWAIEQIQRTCIYNRYMGLTRRRQNLKFIETCICFGSKICIS